MANNENSCQCQASPLVVLMSPQLPPTSLSLTDLVSILLSSAVVDLVQPVSSFPCPSIYKQAKYVRLFCIVALSCLAYMFSAHDRAFPTAIAGNQSVPQHIVGNLHSSFLPSQCSGDKGYQRCVAGQTGMQVTNDQAQKKLLSEVDLTLTKVLQIALSIKAGC